MSTYSGEMRRRLDLAASLVASPSVIFLDEPSTGLDPTGRQAMWQVIAGLAGSGVTVFLTTQYLDEADPDRSLVASFAVHGATLDDVFLTMTGPAKETIHV